MNKDCLKLFLVETKALGKYGRFYVISHDPTSAYNMVRDFLDKKNLCFSVDRELDSITLLAEEYEYTCSGTILLKE
jgi:hypothetical protein